MSDWLTQLRLAIEVNDEMAVNGFAPSDPVIVDAARLLASGRRAKRCETHGCQVLINPTCVVFEYAWAAAEDGEDAYPEPCVVSDVVIVDVPEEREWVTSDETA